MLGQYELLLPISSEELQHEKNSYLQNYAWKSIKIEKLPIIGLLKNSLRNSSPYYRSVSRAFFFDCLNRPYTTTQTAG
jgi:hypothetical protein